MTRLALMLILLLAGPAVAGELARHSGRVVSLDPASGTLRLEELVEGRGAEANAVERTLRLSPGASIVLRRPAEPPAVRWPDSWDAVPVDAADVRPGDFVTVTTRGGDAIALELVRPIDMGASTAPKPPMAARGAPAKP